MKTQALLTLLVTTALGCASSPSPHPTGQATPRMATASTSPPAAVPQPVHAMMAPAEEEDVVAQFHADPDLPYVANSIADSYFRDKVRKQKEGKQRAHAKVEQNVAFTFARLTARDFDRDLVVVFLAGGCGKLPSYSALVENIARREDIHHLFTWVNLHDEEQVAQLNERGLNVRSFPTLIALKKGRIVDYMSSGSGEAPTLHFLRRNGALPGEAGYLEDLRPGKGAARSPGWFEDGNNLEGISYRNEFLSGGGFSAANLRRVDFRGANLENANFSRSDLTGARFEEANVKNAIWFGAICPDGSRADVSFPPSCQGHLSPRRP